MKVVLHEAAYERIFQMHRRMAVLEEQGANYSGGGVLLEDGSRMALKQQYRRLERDRDNKGVSGLKSDLHQSQIYTDYKSPQSGSLLGFAFGYDDADTDTDHNLGGFDSKVFSLASYGQLTIDENHWLQGTVGYGYMDLDTHRLVGGGLGEQKGDTQGHQLQASLKLGHQLASWNSGTLSFISGFDYAGSWIDGYRESGSSAALEFDDVDYHTIQGSLSLEFAGAAVELTKDYSLSTLVGASYLPSLLDTADDLDSNFVVDPANGFTTYTADMDDTAFRLWAGVSLAKGEKVALDLNTNYIHGNEDGSQQLGFSLELGVSF
jgi:uncharacterized protein with beta-barrel porin domain